MKLHARILAAGPLPPPYGGIASVIEDTVNSPLGQKYDFDFFKTSETSRDKSFLGKNLFRLKRFARFFRKVFSGNYALVHAHAAETTFSAAAIYCLLARLAGTPALMHLHGTDWDDFYESNGRMVKWLIRRELGAPSRIIVLYGLWAREISRRGNRGGVTAIGNFLPDAPPPDRGECAGLRTSLGLSEDDFAVLTVGSVGERKGSYEIIRAAPLVRAKDQKIRFLLAGGEEYPLDLEKVSNTVREKGVEDAVRVLGELERDKIPLLLGAAQAFLLPSFFEGMPIAIIEAMRTGLPIIATDVGGVPEMIEHEKSGLLIKPGDPEEIERAVLRLKNDPELASALGRGARKAFERSFRLEAVIDKIEAVYLSMSPDE